MPNKIVLKPVKRTRASFNIDTTLRDALKDKAHHLRMDQSDAVEWGVQKWLEEFAKSTPPKGRPVYTDKGYDVLSALAAVYDNPQTAEDERLVAIIDSVAALIRARRK